MHLTNDMGRNLPVSNQGIYRHVDIHVYMPQYSNRLLFVSPWSTIHAGMITNKVSDQRLGNTNNIKC